MMEQLKIDQSHIHQLVLQINQEMLWVGGVYPTLTLQWAHILMLLNYDNQVWWRRVLGTPGTPGSPGSEDGAAYR